MTVGARRSVRSERAGFRAHDGDSLLRAKLHNAVEPARQFLRRRNHLASALRQVLIADAVLLEQLREHAPVILRPARTRHAPHIADESNPVLFEQLKEVRERMTTMPDGVDGRLQRRHYRARMKDEG